MSLQSMPTALRHTISGHLYTDIDMVNCHPSLLVQYCDKHNIPCPSLKLRVKHRDDLIKASDMPRDQIKYEFLIAMYSDSTSNHALPWLCDVDAELKIIQSRIKAMPSNSQLVNHHRQTANVGGSVMSTIMCRIKNQVLMSCIEYMRLQQLPVANTVLMFDGMMIPKSVTDQLDTPTFLTAMSQFAFQQTGYSAAFTVKPMTKAINLN